ncbi:hypothetical protein [Anaerococcus sp. NML200537]|nr:hypothetical protein [Anaerococcus sp. NML200537]
MATNKRYYWIKLKEEFFTDKRIKRLRPAIKCQEKIKNNYS